MAHFYLDGGSISPSFPSFLMKLFNLAEDVRCSCFRAVVLSAGVDLVMDAAAGAEIDNLCHLNNVLQLIQENNLIFLEYLNAITVPKRCTKLTNPSTNSYFIVGGRI